MSSNKRSPLWAAVPSALLSAGVAYWFGLRPWHISWGATDAEVERSLPGDELVPRPRKWSTRGEYRG